MLSREQARAYAAYLIATQKFDWDEIAERYGDEVLGQEDCDLVKEMLDSCAVSLIWDDDHAAIEYDPLER